jgi:hypothetical protein
MENIIFMHKGDSWYLPYALRQCIKSNPSARIILLGDVSNEKYNSIVEHKLIDDYCHEADEFSKLYQHYSTSPYEYELFCIQRWFIWLNFMKKHNIDTALLPDTDVLILQDISLYFNHIQNFFFTKGESNYMGFMYISRTALSEICNYINNIYIQEPQTGNLKSIFENYLKTEKRGGISDITLFANYEVQHKPNIINTESYGINNRVFVHSMQSKLFQLDTKCYVKVSKGDGLYYVKQNDVSYSVVGMHCFGIQKILMLKYYTGDDAWKAHLKYYWKISHIHQLIVSIRKYLRKRN